MWILPALMAILVTAGSSVGWAYEQRSNTVSLGIQAGAGLFSGSGSYDPTASDADIQIPYEDFDLGPGFSIHVRYGLDRTHAFGLTFEDLRFDRKSGSRTEPEQYQVNNFFAEYYIYFARREKLSRYLGVGLGFHRPSFRVDDQENLLPGEGFIANLSGGLEYFLRRPFSIDASVKGYYGKPRGGTFVAGELLLGVHYYLMR